MSFCLLSVRGFFFSPCHVCLCVSVTGNFCFRFDGFAFAMHRDAKKINWSEARLYATTPNDRRRRCQFVVPIEFFDFLDIRKRANVSLNIINWSFNIILMAIVFRCVTKMTMNQEAGDNWSPNTYYNFLTGIVGVATGDGCRVRGPRDCVSVCVKMIIWMEWSFG